MELIDILWAPIEQIVLTARYYELQHAPSPCGTPLDTMETVYASVVKAETNQGHTRAHRVRTRLCVSARTFAFYQRLMYGLPTAVQPIMS